MNCDSWLPPKNSFMAATTGRMLMSVFGVAWSESVIVIRSLTTRSMRSRPMRNWFWISSPLARMRRLPRWSMSSGSPRPLFSSISLPMMAVMSLRLMTRASRRFSLASEGRSIFSLAATSPRALFSL